MTTGHGGGVEKLRGEGEGGGGKKRTRQKWEGVSDRYVIENP